MKLNTTKQIVLTIGRGDGGPMKHAGPLNGWLVAAYLLPSIDWIVWDEQIDLNGICGPYHQHKQYNSSLPL